MASPAGLAADMEGGPKLVAPVSLLLTIALLVFISVCWFGAGYFVGRTVEMNTDA